MRREDRLFTQIHGKTAGEKEIRESSHDEQMLDLPQVHAN